MDYFDYGHNDLSPEHLLWRSVLALFLEDIQKDYFHYKKSLNGHRGEFYEKLQTHQHYLDDHWTECICDFARLDYGKFKSIVREIISGKKEIKIYAQYRY